MILDTHLHNLIAQYAAADGDQIEQQRLAHEGMVHLQARAPQMSRTNVLRSWAMLIDILTIEV